MADSFYISENLNKTQLEFLKLLDEQEIQLFEFSDIEKQLDQKFESLKEVLKNLVHKELFTRIEKGKFCKPVSFGDEFVIGTFVVEDSAVVYWSPLNLHGLIEEFSKTIFIQTIHKKKTK